MLHYHNVPAQGRGCGQAVPAKQIPAVLSYSSPKFFAQLDSQKDEQPFHKTTHYKKRLNLICSQLTKWQLTLPKKEVTMLCSRIGSAH